MNIVYIAPCRTTFPSRSASSIHMIRMCEALAELGCKVTLIASDNGVGEWDTLNHYGVAAEFKIKFIKVYEHKIGNVFYAVKAARAANKLKPDYVIGRSPSGCYVSCLLGRKVIFDSHGPVWTGNWLDAASYKLMSKSSRLAKMTVNSHALKDIYIKCGWAPRCELVVAHNGSRLIDETKLQKLDAWPGRLGALQVGYVGHLYPGRGVDVILACARELSDVDFHIIGGAEEDITKWKNVCDLKNVHFHGFIQSSIVESYRHQCDVLMAPYQSSGVAVAGGKGDSSSYMNPIKIIEYMASGKAIICSDILILREVLGEQGALFVDPSDVAAWVDAVNLMQQPEFRSQYATKAKAIFSGNLTWHARVKKMIKL